MLHDPVTAVPHILGDYPAHLHIDLLARARSRGLGRALLDTLFEALRANGIPGAHLLVSASNTNGVAFYQAVGFAELPALRLFTMDLTA